MLRKPEKMIKNVGIKMAQWGWFDAQMTVIMCMKSTRAEVLMTNEYMKIVEA